MDGDYSFLRTQRAHFGVFYEDLGKMKRGRAIAVFHLFQIGAIYVPGALIIPAAIFVSLFNVIYAVVVCALLLMLIVTAFVLRPRIARHLGLSEDYE